VNVLIADFRLLIERICNQQSAINNQQFQDKHP